MQGLDLAMRNGRHVYSIIAARYKQGNEQNYGFHVTRDGAEWRGGVYSSRVTTGELVRPVASADIADKYRLKCRKSSHKPRRRSAASFSAIWTLEFNDALMDHHRRA